MKTSTMKLWAAIGGIMSLFGILYTWPNLALAILFAATLSICFVAVVRLKDDE